MIGLHVSINKRVVGKDSAAVAGSPRSWEVTEGGYAAGDFIDYVTGKGFAWSKEFLGSERKKEKFIRSNVLALDIERDDGSGMTWEDAIQDEWIRENALFAYTTPSHQTGRGDRFRIVFVTERIFSGSNEFEIAQKALFKRYSEFSDRSCVDSARLFYGSPNSKVVRFLQVLREDTLEGLLAENAGDVEIDPTDNEETIHDLLKSRLKDGEGRYHKINRLVGYLNRKRIGEDNALAIVSAWNQGHYDPWEESRLSEQVAKIYKTYRIADDQSIPRTLDSLVDILAETLQEEFFFDPAEGKWAEWRGDRWMTGLTDNAVLNRVTRMVTNIRDAAKEHLDPKEDKEVLSWYGRLTTSGVPKDLLPLLSGTLRVDSSTIDDIGPRLVVKNGVIDLRTIEHTSHDKSLRYSKCAPVVFDPTVTCPKWIEFLDLIFPDDFEMATAIQMIVGSTLLGSPETQQLFFLYGPKGANGKSTMIEALKRILGPYMVKVPADVILKAEQDGTKPNPFLLQLRGARIVTTSEPESHAVLSEGMIKDMTGNDVLTARGLYAKTPASWTPTHTVLMYGNHRPAVRGYDDAIWRRLVLLPFDVVIPEEKRRPMQVILEEFEGEASGILNWMLEGLQMYREDGLKLPEKCRLTKEEYREEEDRIQPFLDERYTVDPEGKVTLRSMFTSYTEYEYELDKRAKRFHIKGFSKVLKAKGIEVKKFGGVVHVFGFVSTPGLQTGGEPTWMS